MCVSTGATDSGRTVVHYFYMGDCQNYGPFVGPYYNTGPNTGPSLGDPKRDHNFDNPPYVDVVNPLVLIKSVPQGTTSTSIKAQFGEKKADLINSKPIKPMYQNPKTPKL